MSCMLNSKLVVTDDDEHDIEILTLMYSHTGDQCKLEGCTVWLFGDLEYQLSCMVTISGIISSLFPGRLHVIK